MKQTILALALIMNFAAAAAQTEADRSLATMIADFAQMSKEKVLFTSVECNREMLKNFNIQTNDKSLSKMLEVVNRLYLIQTSDPATATLMQKRVAEMEARSYVKNYTETKQQGIEISIYVPTETKSLYMVALTTTADQSIMLVVTDDNFYNLVERLRSE